MEGEIITMQEIFRFEQTGVDADGKVLGHFCATGVRPRFADRLRMFGIAVPDTHVRSTPPFSLGALPCKPCPSMFFLILSVLVCLAVVLLV